MRRRNGVSNAVREVVMWAKFYRNSLGDSRLEYHRELQTEQADVVLLWSADAHEMTTISAADNQIERFTNPAVPSEEHWGPARPWQMEITNEQRMVRNLLCNRVQLSTIPIPIHPSASVEGECWISVALGIVVLDRSEGPERESVWEITELVEEEPPPSLFRVPPSDGSVTARSWLESGFDVGSG